MLNDRRPERSFGDPELAWSTASRSYTERDGIQASL
jgi:hypothetical protein